MSFERNYGIADPVIDYEAFEEIPPTEEEIQQMYIEQKLAEEEIEIEEIIEADKRRID